MLLRALFFASLIVACYCSHNLSLTYRFSKELGPNYTLFWSFDRATQNISFAVRVRTTGWVGFGLSPNGQMPQSDVVIGWVENGGRSQFHDRFAEVRSTPPIDEQQNWYLIKGEEEDGYTTLEFWRNFISCDSKDRNILPETTRVIWSYHSRDPVSSNSPFMRHENQGSASINFLGQLQNRRTVPPDTNSFTVRPSNSVNVPEADTTYWCSYYNLADFGVTDEVYVYRVAPFISPGNTGLVHHMLLYVCPADTPIVASRDCDTLPKEVVACRGGQIFGSWAVGGTDFIYPEGVALPVGGHDSNPVVLLEVHYNNPDMRNGLQDRSGMEFFFTHQRPTHLAGGLSLGYPVTPDLVIPPGAANFTVQAICSAACLERFLPDDGITVFGSFLHSHLAGRGFVVQHTRSVNGSSCTLEEEMPPIDQNLHYDFNFQQAVILPRPIKIRKGDSIIVSCIYSSQDRNQVIMGGQSTREEMCEEFLFYYPQIPLTACLSTPEPESAYGAFLTRAFDGDTYRSQSTVYAFYTGQVTTIKSSFNSITWNNHTIADYQNSLKSNKNYIEYCFGGTQDWYDGITERQIANISCPYVAPDQCNMSTTSIASCTCETQPYASGASPTVDAMNKTGMPAGLNAVRIVAIVVPVIVVILVLVIIAVTIVILTICFLRTKKFILLDRNVESPDSEATTELMMET